MNWINTWCKCKRNNNKEDYISINKVFVRFEVLQLKYRNVRLRRYTYAIWWPRLRGIETLDYRTKEIFQFLCNICFLNAILYAK